MREKETITADDVGVVDASDLVGNTLPADWKGNPDGTPKTVQAAASFVGSGELAGEPRKRAKRIEAAMADAVRQCLAEGISIGDTETIRRRMREAMALAVDEG